MPDSAPFDPMACTNRRVLLDHVLIIRKPEEHVPSWASKQSTVKSVLGVVNPEICELAELQHLVAYGRMATALHDALHDRKCRVKRLIIVERGADGIWNLTEVTNPNRIQHLPDLDAVEAFIRSIYERSATEPEHTYSNTATPA